MLTVGKDTMRKLSPQELSFISGGELSAYLPKDIDNASAATGYTTAVFIKSIYTKHSRSSVTGMAHTLSACKKMLAPCINFAESYPIPERGAFRMLLYFGCGVVQELFLGRAPK